jgi:hypothetical protein
LAPTEREIGITGGDGRIRDIHVLNVDGSGLRKLIYSRGVQNDDPQWSPDGPKIALTSHDRERRSWISVMNADGGDQTSAETMLTTRRLRGRRRLTPGSRAPKRLQAEKPPASFLTAPGRRTSPAGRASRAPSLKRLGGGAKPTEKVEERHTEHVEDDDDNPAPHLALPSASAATVLPCDSVR